MQYRNRVFTAVFFAVALCIMQLVATAYSHIAFAGEEEAHLESPPTFTGDIVVGATFPLTGKMDYYGQSAYLGANTRVRMINAKGGINGKRLVILWRDNKSSPQKAREDSIELIEKHGVSAIIGPLLSDAALAVSDVASERKVVFISPMASSDTSARDKGWMFRVLFPNLWAASSLSSFQIQNFGARSCAILYDPRYEFSVEFANDFERIFRASGGKVVGILSIIDYYGNKNFTGPLKKLSAYTPDFIFAPTYGIEAVELIHAARDIGITSRFAAPITWDTELVYDASGRRLTGTAIVSTLFERTYRYRSFQEFYRALENAGMDVPDSMAAAAYDAITLLSVGLQNGETAEEIRAAIQKIHEMPLATGAATMLPEGRLQKPLVIRFVEERNGRVLPVFAERFDPE